jgi:predicted MFS family arabinose efflux permease
MDPRHAGAASGVLSTAQQVGNTIGVAAIGAIFYGAIGPNGDYAGAFELALVAVAAVCLAVAALVQLLPGRPSATLAVPSATPAVPSGRRAKRRDPTGMFQFLERGGRGVR